MLGVSKLTSQSPSPPARIAPTDPIPTPDRRTCPEGERPHGIPAAHRSHHRVEGDGVELRTKPVGELTMAWVNLAKGVDLSAATVGLPTTSVPALTGAT